MVEVVQVALDESGYASNRPDDLFVFAGYAGNVQCWEDFTHEWKRIIEHHPELNDCETMKALFRWRGAHSDPRALLLGRAIIASGLKSVRWQISYEEYLSVFPDIKHLWFNAWRGMLARLIAEFRLIPNLALAVYYDRNIGEEERAQADYQRFYAWSRMRMPEIGKALPRRPIAENDERFWPLRAADALAVNQHRSHSHERKKRRPFSNPLWKLLDSGPQCFNEIWTRKDLLEVFPDLQLI
jgi:hypothetical protein